MVRLFNEHNLSDDAAIAVAVIQTLTDVVKHSNGMCLMMMFIVIGERDCVN